jgi:acetoin utilization protein AcuB
MKANWMKVLDVMSPDPLTVSPSDTVGDADELMYENHYRQLPVVKGKEVIGIITDRDIRSFLGQYLISSPRAREAALNAKVEEIMTREPVTVSPEDDLEAAIELLLNEKFGAVPVVDPAEGLVGIVSYLDLLRCFLHRLQEGE